jgi:hypothetical protein
MTTEERIELAVRRTRSRMLDEVPQNPDVLLMLECLSQELAKLSNEKPTR